jgi:hypothetical protein
MSRPGQRAAECPSWTSLARFVEEGRPWPTGHLSSCSACRQRYELLQGLGALGDAGQGGRAVGEPCPDLLEIAALVDGDVEQAERLRLADHIAACESCAGLLRELVAFSADQEVDWEVREGPAEVVPVSARHGPWASSGFRRIAAFLLLAAALTIVYVWPFPPIESGSAGRWRGPAPRLEAAISRAPQTGAPVVSWDEWPDASSYRIRVWNESGRRLLERHIGAGESRRLPLSLSAPPDGSPPAPREGELLFWQVDALESGEIVASTGPTELRWESR